MSGVSPLTRATDGPDPFDPARYRLSGDFEPSIGVQTLITTIPVRKPAKDWFVRTHPDPSHCLETIVLELKEERETFLVDPTILPELGDESTLSPRALFTAINRQGTLFVWPVRLPGANGRVDGWSQSALDAARTAQDRWVRVQANMSLGAYEQMVPQAELPDPEWPEVTFSRVLETAFRDRVIDVLDHPVLLRLRGAV